MIGQAEPRFDLDAEVGAQGELWVKDLRSGLASGLVEVKTKRYLDDCFYVEYECLRRGQWCPSGIQTSDSPTWVFKIADADLAVAISRRLLLAVARDLWARDGGRGRFRKEETHGSHPTRGVLVPLAELLRFLQAEQAA